MKVSVLMLAYNHRKFIARAINSALDQETAFPYEIIIRDDGSSDGTPEILARYQAEYPAILRVLPTDRRLGMHHNLREAYRACQGEYISALDGDDFWSCPLKLQRQVDFLEAHPQCSACFHNALVSDEDGNYSERPFCSPDPKVFCGFADILVENIIPTSAAMYRHRRFLKGFTATYAEILVADWPLNIAYARQGLIGFLPQVMSVYTKHAAGLWTGASREAKVRSIEGMYAAVNAATNHQYAAFTQTLATFWKIHFELEDVRRRLQHVHAQLQASSGPAKKQIKNSLDQLRQQKDTMQAEKDTLQRLIDMHRNAATDAFSRNPASQ